MNKQTVLTRLANSIEEIRQRFAVSSLSIFGSIARNETTENSDVDILVTFEQEATFDLFMDLKFYLEDLLETPIDLVTDKALRPQVRQAIKQEIINVT